MGEVRQVQQLGVVLTQSGLKKLALIALAATAILLPAAAAFAEDIPGTIVNGGAAAAGAGAALGMGNGTFTDYAASVGSKTNLLPDVLTYIAWIMGFLLVFLGISEARKHVSDPSTPLKNPIIKLFAGGLFLSFAIIPGMVSGTMEAFGPFNFIKKGAVSFGGSSQANGGLGSLIANGVNNTTVLVNVAAFAAFIIGLFFVLRGIQLLRAHVESPGNAPLPESLKRLAVGGALLSFPPIVQLVYETFGMRSGAIIMASYTAPGAKTGGLDGMMVNFISDISNAGFQAIEIFCYIAGILIVLFAMQRLVRTAQDGPRGPLTFGTISTFIVAGLLLSFPQFLAAAGTSIFGGREILTQATFMTLNAINADQLQTAKNVFSAILAFMAVIGFLSVVRGLFLFKSFADGNSQATMMSVVSHIVAGAIAINLGSFINAVQTSLGVTTFPLRFG